MTEINEKEDLLLLDKQLCFPLYACARKIVAAYHPFLKKIGLTYTQYVTMMVIWEKKEISVHDLGERLYLDSGRSHRTERRALQDPQRPQITGQKEPPLSTVPSALLDGDSFLPADSLAHWAGLFLMDKVSYFTSRDISFQNEIV